MNLRGAHQRGRAAPIDAHAVALAQQKLMTARHEREARDLIESISNVTRIKIIRALSETPLAAGGLASVVDRRSTSAQILEVIARAFDVLAR